MLASTVALAVLATGVLVAAEAPLAVAEAAPVTESCVVAGQGEGTFPAWNFLGKIEQHAAAPDGSVVVAARGHLWRIAGGGVHRLAGGGATRPTVARGPTDSDAARIDGITGLDVSADGTVWFADGRTLHRLSGSAVVPVWESPMEDHPIAGPARAELSAVRVSAAGVFVQTEGPFSVYRIERVADGVATPVAGGGATFTWNVTEEGTAGGDLRLRSDLRFAVDDQGRLALLETTGVLVAGEDGRFRPTPAVGSGPPRAVAVDGAGAPVVSDDEGLYQLTSGVWVPRPGPPLASMDFGTGGQLIGLESDGLVRRVDPDGSVTPLAGPDTGRALYTNAGRTTSTAFFGRVAHLQADGDDLLVAEDVPHPAAQHLRNSRIVRVRPDGSVVAVAGNGGLATFTPVLGASATASTTAIGEVRDIEVDAAGRVVFSSAELGVVRVEHDGGLTQLWETSPWFGGPHGIELLPDGSIVFGHDFSGSIAVDRRDGANPAVLSWFGYEFRSVVPLPGLHLQSVGDIELDRDGTLVVLPDNALWRLDLAGSVARRVEATFDRNLQPLQHSSPGRGLAIDAVGNVYFGSHGTSSAWSGSARGGLWRLGPDDRLSVLGALNERWPSEDVGDPEVIGQVVDVVVDPSGRLVVADGQSGRIRRLSGCDEPAAVGANPLDPVRLLDTRDGTGFPAGRRPGSGEVVELQVTSRGGVPSGATAVTLNVTVTESTTGSYLTAYPCDGAPPTVSNLNFAAGRTVPNQVTVALSSAGTVCLRSPAATHLVADVQAWYGSGGTGLRPLRPTRLLDTRDGGGRVPAATEVRVPVAGRGGVPSVGAAAAALNVTVTDPAAGSWLTVYPCGTQRPLASNLNFAAGQTVPNAVLASIGDGGDVCLFSPVATHVVVDVVGSWDPGGEPVRFLRPERIVDTRSAWGRGGPTRLRAGQVTQLRPTGAVGVEPGAPAVVVNATGVDAAAPGFVTLYPCGGAPPLASTLNVAPGAPTANAVAAATGPDGTLCALASTDVDLVLDVAGHI